MPVSAEFGIGTACGVSALVATPYQRRRPEDTALYQVVQEHLETFLSQASELTHSGAGYPSFIEDEFRRYLRCGIFSYGFLRVRCESCGQEDFVAFSCKARAVCPSCAGRRMNETAAKLIEVLPVAPYRQWTLSVPHRFRCAMVRDPKFFTAVINICIRRIFAWQKRRARALGISSPRTASVTSLQRFGSKINLHPHMHAVVPDGVFADMGEGLALVELEAPTDEEVETLCIDIARRIVKRSKAWLAEGDEDDEVLSAAQDECLRLPLPERPPSEPKKRPRCALVAGFSLDANTFVEADDRPALERLLRYGFRPPFAQSRLSITPKGLVSYKLRRPWHTGQTEIVLPPLAFLKRLSALIPPPRQNQIRFHGLVGPNAKGRAEFVRLASAKDSGEVVGQDLAKPTNTNIEENDNVVAKSKRIAWAQLLKRIFNLEVLICPACNGQRRIIAAVTKGDAMVKILTHLGLPSEPPPIAPARAPPQTDFSGDGWGCDYASF